MPFRLAENGVRWTRHTGWGGRVLYCTYGLYPGTKKCSGPCGSGGVGGGASSPSVSRGTCQPTPLTTPHPTITCMRYDPVKHTAHMASLELSAGLT
eukprot:5974017-Prymnesium_polylepis.1